MDCILLNFLFRNEENDNVGHLTPGSSVSYKAQEPNVDLELDVKVFINSGKCVLHTKPKDDDPENRENNNRTKHD